MEGEISEDIDAEDNGSMTSEDMELISEDYEAYDEMRYNRIVNRRETRLAREQELIAHGGEVWIEKFRVQESKEIDSRAALAKLFRATPNLRRVEIGASSIDMEDFGFVDPYDRFE